MPSVTDILGFLRLPSVLRDVFVAVSGLASMLFFQFIIGLDIFSKFNLLGTGRIEVAFLVLVSAYVVGRLLRMMAELACIPFNLLGWFLKSVVLNPQPLKIQWAMFKSNWRHPMWKITLRKFLGLSDIEIVSPRAMEHEITAMEMADAVQRYPSLGVEKERNIYQMIVADVALSTTLISGYFYHHYYWIISALLVYLIISARKQNEHSEYIVYRAVVKDLDKKRLPIT